MIIDDDDDKDDDYDDVPQYQNLHSIGQLLQCVVGYCEPDSFCYKYWLSITWLELKQCYVGTDFYRRTLLLFPVQTTQS